MKGLLLIMRYFLPMMLAIPALRAEECQDKEKTEQGVMSVVKDFANRHGYTSVHDLTARMADAEKPAELQGVSLYDIQEGSFHREDGHFQADAVSDGPEWTVAVAECGEYFKLRGFGDEAQFDSLAQYLGWRVENADQALKQVLLYFKFVYGLEPPMITSSTSDAVQAATYYCSYAGKDAESLAKAWVSQIPEDVRKSISPPTPSLEPHGFLVDIYGVEALRLKLSLMKYSVRIGSDGKVVIAHQVSLYSAVPDERRGEPLAH